MSSPSPVTPSSHASAKVVYLPDVEGSSTVEKDGGVDSSEKEIAIGSKANPIDIDDEYEFETISFKRKKGTSVFEPLPAKVRRTETDSDAIEESPKGKNKTRAKHATSDALRIRNVSRRPARADYEREVIKQDDIPRRVFETMKLPSTGSVTNVPYAYVVTDPSVGPLVELVVQFRTQVDEERFYVPLEIADVAVSAIEWATGQNANRNYTSCCRATLNSMNRLIIQLDAEPCDKCANARMKCVFSEPVVGDTRKGIRGCLYCHSHGMGDRCSRRLDEWIAKYEKQSKALASLYRLHQQSESFHQKLKSQFTLPYSRERDEVIVNTLDHWRRDVANNLNSFAIAEGYGDMGLDKNFHKTVAKYSVFDTLTQAAAASVNTAPAGFITSGPPTAPVAGPGPSSRKTIKERTTIVLSDDEGGTLDHDLYRQVKLYEERKAKDKGKGKAVDRSQFSSSSDV
ncbi:unnamed protein product [Cutaneotrichosporon oleaginosum]